MKLPTDWQLKSPVRSIVFDCDSTLSTIEGIDQLAELNGVGETVKELTAQAMGHTGINVISYQQRLEKVKPTFQQVMDLGEMYFAHRTLDVFEVIQLLQRLNKDVYIVSAGFSLSIAQFANLLHVPTKHIFAVELQFDAAGNYVDFDAHSPLVMNQGKREIVKHIPKEILYVGDGLNDCAVMDLVSRFVGYGGAYYREKIAEMCEFYLTASSMTTLLPLVLTEDEIKMLMPMELALYQKGLDILLNK